MFEIVVDDVRTYDGRTPEHAYPLSSPMSFLGSVELKTVDISETIGLKVGTCRQLIEFMKVC